MSLTVTVKTKKKKKKFRTSRKEKCERKIVTKSMVFKKHSIVWMLSFQYFFLLQKKMVCFLFIHTHTRNTLHQPDRQLKLISSSNCCLSLWCILITIVYLHISSNPFLTFILTFEHTCQNNHFSFKQLSNSLFSTKKKYTQLTNFRTFKQLFLFERKIKLTELSSLELSS